MGLLGKSTLAKSAHFEDSKVMSYRDYSDEFKTGIAAIHAISITAAKQRIKPIKPLGQCWVPPIVAFSDRQVLLRGYS